MYGKKVKLRFLFLTLILASVVLSIYLVLQSLEENVVYFQSPSEIKKLTTLYRAMPSRCDLAGLARLHKKSANKRLCHIMCQQQ